MIPMSSGRFAVVSDDRVASAVVRASRRLRHASTPTLPAAPPRQPATAPAPRRRRRAASASRGAVASRPPARVRSSDCIELRFEPVNESLIEPQTYLYYIQTPGQPRRPTASGCRSPKRPSRRCSTTSSGCGRPTSSTTCGSRCTTSRTPTAWSASASSSTWKSARASRSSTTPGRARSSAPRSTRR